MIIIKVKIFKKDILEITDFNGNPIEIDIDGDWYVIGELYVDSNTQED